jgi:uncharacterized membrane protein
MVFGTSSRTVRTDGRVGVSARRRVGVAAAVGTIVGAVSALMLPWQLAPLLGYDVAAALYVASIWLTVWKLDARQTARHAEREDPTRAAADLILLVAAVASLVAVAYVIVRARASDGGREAVQVGFGVLSVVISWLLIHTVFALRYARIYYAGPDGGADFHQAGPPRFSDFAYLAFTVGMTFQVSDTELNSSTFRANVLRHSLMSYLFGTVIVALAINLIAGLTR